ncbi:putative lipase C14C8.15 [Bienertia sinuspersici]
MKILSWNFRGIGHDRMVSALQDWCWRERPNLVFLMETMIDMDALEITKKKCGFSKGVCPASEGRSSVMGMWWNELKGTPSWRDVGVYGWPEHDNKFRTWDLMRRIQEECPTPILFFGDFNEILGELGKRGGERRSEMCMDGFRQAIDDCVIRDMGYKGSIFTWQRRVAPETIVREILDRFLAYWLSKEECEKVVKRAGESGVGEFAHVKIFSCVREFREWAGVTFDKVRKRIKEAEKFLSKCQEDTMEGANLEQCKMISQDLDEL